MVNSVIPSEIAETLKVVLPNAMAERVIGVSEIAGVALISEERRSGFMCFHDYITNPQPDWLTSLRASDRSSKWYSRLVDGIFWNVQGARRAVQYHWERISEIENAVQFYLSSHDLSKIPHGTCEAIGNTQKLDFEYHAFVFAYRRALEYFAGGIAAYFKSDCNSFKDLPHVFNRRQSPSLVRDPLLAIFNAHKHCFDFVLSDGDTRHSIRDRISHYEFVSAGIFNLTCEGLRLVGGGEKLSLNGSTQRLCDVLNEKVNDLDGYLNSSLIAFVDALKNYHS